MLTGAMIDAAEARVSRATMPGDHMLNAANPGHYFSVGRSAMTCIQAAFAAAKVKEAPRRILDFACGSGRVTRWLTATFPTAKVVCSDLRSDSLAFLAAELGVETQLSSEGFDDITFEAPFDLVWSGSLVTHLPADAVTNMLAGVARWLGPQGVAVITTHGREVAYRMAQPTQKYVRGQDAPRVVADYAATGYGYVDYLNRKGIGCSVVAPERFIAMARDVGLDAVQFADRGWDNHQDSFAFVKART